MKTTSQWPIAALIALAFATPASAASLSALSTFNGGTGYLAPGSRPYLDTSNNQRGFAYNPATGHLLVVNRTGGLSINVLDAATGADLGALNQGSGVITGGTFAGSMVGVGDDGAIYMANLTTNSALTGTSPYPYKIYRWANESATPTVAFSGQGPTSPLSGARIGDSLDVFGSGANTRIVAGYNNSPSVSGNNSFALFTTADGANFSAANIAVGTPPSAGDFKLGITFTDSDTIIGKSGANGRVVDITGANSGTLNTSFTLDGSAVNPMDYAVVGSRKLLAVMEASGSVIPGGARLFVYDVSNPSSPVQIAVKTNQPGASNVDGNGVGQVKFGPVGLGGNSIAIYAMATNNGIQAFTLTGVPEPTSLAMLVLGFVGFGFARRRN